MKKIKILLIEDNRLLREGIAFMLKKQSDMHVVSTIGNGENILTQIEKLKPNIVLIDLGLRSQNSLNVVKLIKKDFQETKIIVMDLIPLQSGCFRICTGRSFRIHVKDVSINELLKTIRSVYQGAKVLPPHLTGSLFSQIVEHAINGSKPSIFTESVRITKRERQVIELIAEGSTNKEIAQKLHLSPYTVKSHVHNILEKLALHTRVQIAKYTHIYESHNTAIDTDSLRNE